MKHFFLSIVSFLLISSFSISTLSAGVEVGGGSGWKSNYRLALVSRVVGTHREWVNGTYMGPMVGMGSGYYATANSYVEVNCCITAGDSDACNSAMAESRC